MKFKILLEENTYLAIKFNHGESWELCLHHLSHLWQYVRAALIIMLAGPLHL